MSQKYKVYINNKPKIITDHWDVICDRYKLIDAAGGVVYNDKDQLLMIFRNEKWDLPKGKLEKGESIKECAVREVEEECGVYNLQIIRQLMNTYHIYELNGENIIKRTHWFRMKTYYNGVLKPQQDEGIEKAIWLNNHDIDQKIDQTFGNIKQLLHDELH